MVAQWSARRRCGAVRSTGSRCPSSCEIRSGQRIGQVRRSERIRRCNTFSLLSSYSFGSASSKLAASSMRRRSADRFLSQFVNRGFLYEDVQSHGALRCAVGVWLADRKENTNRYDAYDVDHPRPCPQNTGAVYVLESTARRSVVESLRGVLERDFTDEEIEAMK